MRRLAGLESEYAIVFTPGPGGRRPSNARIYNAILSTIASRVRWFGKMGEGRDALLGSVFVQNGGAFSYEGAESEHGGLLEGATPECTTALQLVAYQRAQEAELRAALPEAHRRLARDGYAGTVALLKNCRDAAGHRYGAQENYTVEIADGWRLVALRTALALTLPLHVAMALAFWAVVLIAAVSLVVFILVTALVSLAVPAARRLLALMFDEGGDDPPKDHRSRLHVVARALDVAFHMLPLVSWACIARAFALHRFRRQLGAFLVSRPILTGAGTLDGRRFSLSEKAPSVRRAMRLELDPRARGMFDAADILKGVGHLFLVRPRSFFRAFARRQRVQMGCSDANMAQSAELLKVGTMLLLLEMLDAGALDDAPRPRDLVGALHAIDADPELRARVALVGGGEATALELQRWYFDRARQYVASADVVSMETQRLLALWERVLDALERDPSALVGTLDWVTKRALIDGCEDLSPAALKKIDLRYHDIAEGYLVELEASGAAPTVVTAGEVDRARTEPPAGSRAQERARLIAELFGSGEAARVDWDYVRVGGWLRGRTIVLR